MRFGCHLSISQGYLAAAKKAVQFGVSTFQYFPKNPRSLSMKKFDEKDANDCKIYTESNGLVSVAHTPYPTSLTPTTSEKKEMVLNSLKNDLEIAEACGSFGVVVHFGNQLDAENPLESYKLMIEMLNLTLNDWEGKCKILLENNAGKPGEIGTTLEEFAQIRNLCHFPEKVGFCFDTCHAFASGLWTGDNCKELLHKGEELDYLPHLDVIHLNNSKYPVRSRKDRHENIFHEKGYIQMEAFEELFLSNWKKDLPFILETPSNHEYELTKLNNKWGK